MTNHIIVTDKKNFDLIKSEKKKAIVAKGDFDIQLGDSIQFRDSLAPSDNDLISTWDDTFIVTHIQYGGGMARGFVVLSIEAFLKGKKK